PSYSHEPYPYRDIHGHIRKLYDAFGPERMFWGTDITRMPTTWKQCVTMFTEELPWLPAQDKELIMGRALCAWLASKLQGRSGRGVAMNARNRPRSVAFGPLRALADGCPGLPEPPLDPKRPIRDQFCCDAQRSVGSRPTLWRTVCADFVRASRTQASSRARTWRSSIAGLKIRSIDCPR